MINSNDFHEYKHATLPEEGDAQSLYHPSHICGFETWRLKICRERAKKRKRKMERKMLAITLRERE